MDKENMTYASAMDELEKIVRQVENNEMNIDDLTDNLTRAQELVKYCKEKLLRTEEEVNKILSSDDLKAVSAPQQGGAAPQQAGGAAASADAAPFDNTPVDDDDLPF